MKISFHRAFFMSTFAIGKLASSIQQNISYSLKQNCIMKQKKSDKDVSRRPKGWAMSVANQLRWHKGFTPGEAVRQAYKVQNCLKALGKGVVKFSYYEKKDGSLRQAVGTLCKGISAAYDNYEYKEQPGEATCIQYEYFLYWDLEVEGYRTFKAARLIEFKTL